MNKKDKMNIVEMYLETESAALYAAHKKKLKKLKEKYNKDLEKIFTEAYSAMNKIVK